MEHGVNTTERYFAAANGFIGFKSYFREVFASEEYDKIFVLKGGPGTGKSQLMKRLENHFSSKGYRTEAIFCSSDPHSLDGVIIYSEDKKCAMLDGTAPHERDAVIPGAIDEIVNLGVGWEDKFLVSQKEKILSLGKEKSAAYKTAYEYLALAGEANAIKERTKRLRIDKSKALRLTNEILDKIGDTKCGGISTRLVSSFGRLGSYKLDTAEKRAEKVIKICGSDEISGIILRQIVNELSARGAEMIVLPSAIDGSLIDGVILNSGKTALLTGTGDEAIDISEIISEEPTDKERARVAEEIYKTAMLEAERWFKIASDFHFRLEEIYTGAMNFEENDKIFVSCREKIENILNSDA